MSPIGHSLMGIGLAMLTPVFTQESNESKKTILCRIRSYPVFLLTIACFVGLANLPDWPLPNWGHQRYDISHSLFTNSLLISCVALVSLRIFSRRSDSHSRQTKATWNHYLMLGGVAWLSHLLLDSFYNHSEGIMIGWPFSQIRLALPIAWLATFDVNQPLLSHHNLTVAGYEMITFMPLVIIAWWVRAKGIYRPSAF